MKQTITTYFLPAILILAVLFAFGMGATVYQKKPMSVASAGSQATPEFAKYWFSGKAELNRYQLQQGQYGALHSGQAVLIFVTEDFRTDTQVKSETEASRDKAVPVLKTNLIKRFQTGIYDYSLFTSVFTPINNTGHSSLFPNTLKVSTSAQEWCGHNYVQLNLRDNAYQVSGQSYFEKEVAENYTVPNVWLEDELWNRIRLTPDKLPTGEVTLIPGTMSARLRHKRLDPLPAEAQLAPYAGTQFRGDSLQTYTVNYKTDGRTLLIAFEKAFPHQIVGWEETYTSKGKRLTSRAILQKTIQTDYWNHNMPADSAFLVLK